MKISDKDGLANVRELIEERSLAMFKKHHTELNKEEHKKLLEWFESALKYFKKYQN